MKVVRAIGILSLLGAVLCIIGLFISANNESVFLILFLAPLFLVLGIKSTISPASNVTFKELIQKEKTVDDIRRDTISSKIDTFFIILGFALGIITFVIYILI